MLMSFDRLFALLLIAGLPLAACSSSTSSPSDAGDGGPILDAGDAGDAGDSGLVTDGGDAGLDAGTDAGIDAGIDAGTEPDGGDGGLPDSGTGLYCPSGYTLTPYLTETALTHTYSQADQVLDAQKDYVAVLETDQGRIVLHLLSTDAPITCNSFVFLTLHHFFDGIAFHRVLDGFFAQGGDPNTIYGPSSTWGTGGPGYSFGLEVTPTLNYDGPGVVGMARTSDPNSNGSQFFITFSAQHSLDQMYTIFAEVTEGMDVLPNIVRGQPPANPTRMTQVHACEQ
jgi:peptidylprolyl isomerase